MSEQPTPAAVTAAPESLGQRVGSFFHRADADAEALAARLQSLLQDRSGEALDVAGDFVALVRLVDPAMAPLAAAVQALLPKVLSMAENAARDARNALGTSSPPAP